ncbi:hypothetical protein [Demequina sp. NBRC 110052]|uniref:hypothetical protein n=1 Tax=Demequina sp. NBRC 110052 TaxID=1570341 RepID=UPI000A054D8C|nr:hypothetical protein [Demequina sp. NBRC 110052]
MDGIVQHAAALSDAARRELEAGLATLARGGTPGASRVAPRIAELDARLWNADRLADTDTQVAP